LKLTIGARRHTRRRRPTPSLKSFAEGRCPVCKNARTSYAKDAPCLHRLLRPEWFEKDGFPRIAERYSLAQVELFMRRVANQEALAKNINDMASEGTGKLVELTAKYKGFEWAISCAKSDYDGHGNTEESQRPHYHFQMRIDGKRFIDYSDYHLPLHHSDILTMEAVRLAPGKITRNYVGGEAWIQSSRKKWSRVCWHETTAATC
jgi:hypothetical protein